MCTGGGGSSSKTKKTGILGTKAESAAAAAAAANPVANTQPAAPMAPVTPTVPTSVDPVVQQARAAAVRKNRVATGSRATVLTRGAVVASQRASLSGTGSSLNNASLGAPSANKVLLGQ